MLSLFNLNLHARWHYFDVKRMGDILLLGCGYNFGLLDHCLLVYLKCISQISSSKGNVENIFQKLKTEKKTHFFVRQFFRLAYLQKKTTF